MTRDEKTLNKNIENCRRALEIRVIEINQNNIETMVINIHEI